jgi:hypothetical protein
MAVGPFCERQRRRARSLAFRAGFAAFFFPRAFPRAVPLFGFPAFGVARRAVEGFPE